MYQKSEHTCSFLDQGFIDCKSGKAPSGGRAEIKNVNCTKNDIIFFNCPTRWHISTLSQLFPSVDHCSKSYIKIFDSTFPIYGPLLKKGTLRFLICQVLTNLVYIWLHA